jgi:hypothetical protein
MLKRNALKLCIRHLLMAAVLLTTAHCLLTTVAAQSATATLSGEVVDQNGAVVPGANVTVTNTGTGQARHATTNESGSFSIPLLPPGTYTINAQHDGFAPVRIQDVVLNVGDQKALQIQLKAGDINATVQVINDADLIKTDAAVGTVVDRQFVANMPLNGRSLQSLIALTPGVVFQTVNNNAQAGGQFSVNGQRPNANYFMVDGVSANFGITTGNSGFVGQSGAGALPGLTAVGGTNSLVSIDALQEFKIQTSSYAPEFGRMPGGQISLITRSGTNSFHGNLFDYLRNDLLDANDWFANSRKLPKAKERQNDFGGVIGGPIIKDRTFFFFSYEGLRLRQPVTKIVAVPTLQARQIVPDVIKPFFNAYPLPTGQPLGNDLAEFAASYSNPASVDAYSIRIDHSLRQKLALIGTYKHSPSSAAQRGAALNNITSNLFGNDSVTVGLTWLASSSITNDLRFNWARVRSTTTNTTDSLGGAVVPADSTLFAPPLSRNNAFFAWQANLSAPLIFIGTGNDNIERQINLVDTLSWVRGSHQLKLGVDYRRISPILNRAGGNFTVLIFNVSAQPTLFLAQIARGSDESIAVFKNYSAYAQDTWAVNPRLTLTYGLRWDLNPPPTSANGHHPSVLLGVGGTGPATLASRGAPLYKTQYANFGPRFGASYHLSKRSGRETVLRGGAGVFYDLGTGRVATTFDHVFPFFASAAYFNVLYPLDPNLVKPPVLGVDPPQQLFLADPDLKLPYVVQWNVALEESLGRNQTLTVSYVGSAGRRLLRESASGTTVSGFGTTVIPYKLTTNESRSDYRALQVQFQRRLSRGIQGLLSYTWARSYDTSSDDTGLISTQVVRQHVNLDQEYAPSDFDVRHTLTGALTVDLPAVSASHGIRALTKGWSLDALQRFRTALPTNVITRTQFAPVTVFNRPNVVPGLPQVLYGPQYPGGKALNFAAFVNPPANTLGDSKRNGLRFFSASQLDVALRRQFGLTDRIKLQLRLEFFNVLNHPNFSDPNGRMFSTTGNVSTQMLAGGLGGLNPLYQIGGPRSGQVSLKFLF